MSENETVICWKEQKRIVGGEVLSEKSLEISLSLKIGENTIPFYLSDEGLVRWDGKVQCWGNLKKDLRYNPPFSLDRHVAIPVEVFPYSGMWKCDLYEVQVTINAIEDKIRRRNRQIEDLREKLQLIKS